MSIVTFRSFEPVIFGLINLMKAKIEKIRIEVRATEIITLGVTPAWRLRWFFVKLLPNETPHNGQILDLSGTSLPQFEQSILRLLV